MNHETHNDVFVTEEVIPGMGSLGGTRPKFNDASTIANLAILSVMLNPTFDNPTGKNYTTRQNNRGVTANGYSKPHMHRRLHQDNTRID